MNTPTNETTAAANAAVTITEAAIVAFLHSKANAFKQAHPEITTVELRLKNEEESRWHCWATLRNSADDQIGHGETIDDACAMALKSMKSPASALEFKRAKLEELSREVAALESQVKPAAEAA